MDLKQPCIQNILLLCIYVSYFMTVLLRLKEMTEIKRQSLFCFDTLVFRDVEYRFRFTRRKGGRLSSEDE